ncbi:hypothetical protein ACJMK2_037699 [Sinanodonta woodiana]|uniref:SWIM-type domain-containing protein n=1 Tax=Sinanodonta woodiana TaxID=1069815 RepID=A0ABD3WL86_SINWO
MASKIAKCSSKPKYIDSLDHQHHPYQIEPKKFSANEEQLPDVTFGDIIMYLVNGASAYTLEQFEAYKSLEDYNYVVSGWVDHVNTYKPEGCANVIATAKRLNAKPLEPWIIASPQGTVLSAHCTCMAGLGESCSHFAALLFYIEEMHTYRERVSVTGKLAYWMKPSKKSVEYKKLSCIDFRSATKLKQLIILMLMPPISAAGISDMKQILRTFEKNNNKPAIITLLEPFCEKFKPHPQSEHLLSPLFTLRNENTDSMSLEELLDYCSKLDISITNEQVNAVEKETHLQNKCKLWHHVREGRITSTTLHSVCHTNPKAPSISLLKSLTSASVSVQTYQMVWGVKMKDVAKRQYTGKMKETHDLFSITHVEFLHPDMPFMGSSPDVMISCVCCGKGCIEIKCDNVMFCRTHPYYSQVQCHIHMSGSEYCDFIVWTKSDIFIEIIEPNTAFWNNVLSKANIFWQSALLPELVGKYFTRRVNNVLKPHISTTLPSQAESGTNSQSSEEELWCSCRKPEYGRMIACDERRLWYCLECSQTKQLQVKVKASKKNKK